MENLESLSNTDLRAKCLEFGLPNIPVTDSTRNVLISKLRAVASPAVGSAQKNRRETMHVSVSASPSSKAADTNDRSSNRASNRRTLGGPATTLDVTRRDEKAAEKIIAPSAATVVERPPARSNIEAVRREEPVAEKPKAVVAASASTVVAAAPISNRRLSVREEVINRLSVQETEPMIIIESDEEDDMLAELATKAEQQNKALTSRHPEPVLQPTRGTVYSKTATVTASYVAAPRAELKHHFKPNEDDDTTYSNANLPQDKLYNFDSMNAARSQFTQPAAKATQHTLPTRQTLASPRYSGYQNYSSPRYSSAHVQESSTFYSPSVRRNTPMAASTLRPQPYYNENSDDPDANEEAFQTPFLSTFARNLERLKVEPSGRVSVSPSISDIGGDVAMRRHKRNTLYNARVARAKVGEESAFDSLHELWVVLDRKYNLKRNSLLLLVIVIVVFFYVLFSP